MTFIIALICLTVERFWDGIGELRVFGWFTGYQSMLNKRLSAQSFWTGYSKLAGYIVPLLVLVFVTHTLLVKTLSVGAFIFAVIMVIYCVGPANIYAQAKKCVIKNVEGREAFAVEQANNFFGFSFADDNALSRLEFSETVLSLANQRLFAVLFWFAILGPVGAVLYRLIALCAENSDVSEPAKRIQQVLDWVPARLLSFSYALTGNFITVMPVLLSRLLNGLDQSNALLKACSRAVFDNKEEEAHKALDPSQTMSLLDRGLIFWLVVLALLIVT